MNKTRTLAILVFNDVEVLDCCGPFKVFAVARRFTEPPAFNVMTVAEKTARQMEYPWESDGSYTGRHGHG